MHRFSVGKHLAVEGESCDGFGRLEAQLAGGAEKVTVASPELEKKIVDGVMAVRISREDGAVDPPGRVVEEACDTVELLPTGGRVQGGIEFTLIGTNKDGGLKESGAEDGH